MADELAQQCLNLRSIETELNEVKASFKARAATSEALVQQCSQALTSGFEFRTKPFLMFLDPKTRKRYLFLEEKINGQTIDVSKDCYRQGADIVEDMQPQDFQQELPGVEAQAEKGGAK